MPAITYTSLAVVFVTTMTTTLVLGQSTNLYDVRTNCSLAAPCAVELCRCYGAVLAPTASNQSSTASAAVTCVQLNVSSPAPAFPLSNCSEQTRCVVAYTRCLDSAVASARSPSELEGCGLAALQRETIALDAGSMAYRGSPVESSCIAVSDTLMTGISIRTFNASALSCTSLYFPAACLSPVRTPAQITLTGNWTAVDADASFRADTASAVRDDLQRALNVSVAVRSLRSGSLIVQTELFESPTSAIGQALRDLSGASAWLARTRAVYSAQGQNPNDVTTSDISSPAIEQPPTAIPSPSPFDDLEARGSGDVVKCGSGCVAGIVFVSLLGAAILVTIGWLLVPFAASCLRKKAVVPASPTTPTAATATSSTARIPFAAKCRSARVDEELCRKIFQHMKGRKDPLKAAVDASGDVKELKAYHALLFIAQSTHYELMKDMKEKGKSSAAGYNDPSHTLAYFFVQRDTELHTKLNQPSRMALYPVLPAGADAGDANSLRKVFGYEAMAAAEKLGLKVPLNELLRCIGELQDAAVTTTSSTTDGSADWDEALLCLVVGLCRCDTAARRERCMFLDLHHDECLALREQFAHMDSVDCHGFAKAIRNVTGEWPLWRRMQGLFPVAYDSTLLRRKRLSTAEIVRNSTTKSTAATDRSFFLYFATRRLQRAYRITRALKFVPFLALFITYVSLQYGLNESYFLTHASHSPLRDEKFPALSSDFPLDCTPDCKFWESVYQNFDEVALHEDAVNWLQGPMLQRFWANDDSTAAAPISGVNIAVGALRIRQVRTKPFWQPDRYFKYFPPENPDFVENFQATAADWFAVSSTGLGVGRDQLYLNNRNRDVESFGGELNASALHPRAIAGFYYRTAQQLNASAAQYHGVQGVYDSDGFALVIPFNFTGAEAAKIVADALTSNWIDLNTRAVFVEAMVYGRQVQSVARVRFTMEFATGGSISPSYDSYAFPLFHRDLFPNIYFAFLALYWLVGFVYCTWSWWKLLYDVPAQATRDNGRSGLKSHLISIVYTVAANPVSVLELPTTFCFVATVALRSWWIYWDVDRIGDELVQVEGYPRYLDRIAFVLQGLGYVHATQCGLMCLLSLAYLSENERLAVVVNTLRRAGSNLLSLACVFAVGVVAFAIAGHIAFGSQIYGFSTMFLSLGTMLLAVNGNFDYDAWKHAHVDFAPVYFAVFQMVLILLLLNMVITVLMDAFGEEMESHFDEASFVAVMVNDPNVAIPRPTIPDRLLNNAVTNDLVSTFKRSRAALKKGAESLLALCGKADPSWSYEAEVDAINRSDQYRFWQQIYTAINFIQFGSVFEAALAHGALAQMMIPLADGGYDHIEVPKSTADSTQQNSSFLGGARDNENKAAEQRTLFGMLKEEYNDGDVNLVLHLLQALPNYHLGVPSSVLLLDLARIRFEWRAHIADFTTDDSEAEKFTTWYANYAMDSHRDAIADAALVVQCRKHSLKPLLGKPYLLAGFRPIINPDQAAAIRRGFSNQVNRNRADSAFVAHHGGEVPLGITVVQAAELFERHGVGYESPEERIASERRSRGCTSVLQGRSSSIPTAELFGPIAELVNDDWWIGALSLDNMLNAGVEEFLRRTSQCLSLNWTASQASAFFMAACQYSQDRGDGPLIDVCEPIVTTKVIPPDPHEEEMQPAAFEESVSEAFVQGYEAATGTKWNARRDQEMLPFLRGVTISTFLNYATKTPAQHHHLSFFGHFARSMALRADESLQLFWYTVFLVLFTIFVITGRGLTEASNMHNSLMELMETQQYTFPYVNKSDDQFIYITCFDDWKGFMNDIILPTIYPEEGGTGVKGLPNLPASAVGALRVRQWRSKRYDCSDKLSGLLGLDPAFTADETAAYTRRIQESFSDSCVHHWSVAHMDKAETWGANVGNAAVNDTSLNDRLRNAWRFQSCRELGSHGDTKNDYYSFPCSGFAWVAPLNLTLAEATTDLTYLLNNNWIDEQTAGIVLDIAYFNFGVNIITRYRFLLSTAVSGGFQPLTQVVSYVPWIGGERSTGYIAFLAIYLIVLALQYPLFAYQLLQQVRWYRTQHVARGKAIVWSITHHGWNFVTFCTLGVFLAAWVVRAKLMVRGTNLMEIYDPNRVIDDADYQASMYHTLTILDAVCALTTYGRLVAFSRRIPALHIISRTFALAAKDMFSLILVFALMFWCFVFMFFTLFGATIEDFATFTRTCASLSKLLIGEEIDYSELSQLYPYGGGLYYVLYLIVCSFVLFNLIIAVLNKAFEQARLEQYDSTSLEATILNDATAGAFKAGWIAAATGILNAARDEIMFIARISYWLLTAVAPCFHHTNRQEALLVLFRHPRWFWWQAASTLDETNPAAAWLEFIKQLAKLDPAIKPRAWDMSRVTVLPPSASPSPHTSPNRTGAGRGASAGASDKQQQQQKGVYTTVEDEGDEMTESTMFMVSDLHHTVNDMKVSYGELQQMAAGAGDASSATIGVGTGRATDRELRGPSNVGEALGATDVRQSFFDNRFDPSQWRAQRVSEVFAKDMCSYANEGLQLIAVASVATKAERTGLMVLMLQAAKEYQLHASAYDGRSIRTLRETHAAISQLRHSVAATSPTLSQQAPATGDVHQMLENMGLSSWHDGKKAQPVSSYWLSLLEK